MQDQNIVCPHCGKEFPLSSTLTHQLDVSIRKDLEKQFEIKQKEFIEKEKIAMWTKAQEEARKKQEKELLELKNAQAEKEVEAIKERHMYEEKERRMRIEMEKQKQEARKEAVMQIQKEMDEENKLKLSEKDKQIEQMTKTIQDLNRQSQQGSMQVQGDALETDLKQLLSANFPIDQIEDVATGIKGADLIHTIRSQFGESTGVILWECKNTKGFSQEWIKKLKDDQITAKADLCILVTKTLPEGINYFGMIDGIHILNIAYVLPFTKMIRANLETTAKIKKSMMGNDEKMRALALYIHSPEFTNKFQNLIRPFISMKQDLESEKRSMMRTWSKREKELDRAISSASSIYGDLEGTTGKKLPSISTLELPSDAEEIKTRDDNNDPNVELF